MPYVPSPRKRRTSLGSPTSDNATLVNTTSIPLPRPSNDSSDNNGLLTNVEKQLYACNISMKILHPEGDEDNNSYTFNSAALSSPTPQSGNNERENSLVNTSISSDEDNLPLSLSFIRKPSRSGSMTVDVDRIMKQNTLMNSRSFEALVDNKPITTNNTSNDDDTDNRTLRSSTDSLANIDEPSSPLSPLYSYNSPNINNDTSNANNYSYPLIRKKSGELVKSSLKLNSMYKSSGAVSLPSTPTYKQVHFGNNIAIKYFDQKDKPNSISADNSPYNSDLDDSISDNEIDTSVYSDGIDDEDDDTNPDGVDYYGFSTDDTVADPNKYFNKTRCFCDKLYKVSKNVVESETPLNVEKFKNTMKNWNLDTSEFKSISYRDQIDCEVPVFLERCFLNLDKTLIIGQIAVKNVSFTKVVKIRYSFDNWFTIVNVDAKYTSDIPRILKKSGYDRFIFQLSTPLLLSTYFNSSTDFLNSAPKFEFCIKYTAGGQDFWDNNHSRNYRLNFMHEDLNKNINLKTSPTPTKIRPFDDSYFSFKKSDNISTDENKLLNALKKESGENEATHPISETAPSSGSSLTSNSTLSPVVTLKKSRSFDKRNNIKSLISSPEFQVKNMIHSDDNTSNDVNIMDLNQHTKRGLKNNFLDKDNTRLPSSNTRLKNDNENILVKLKELEIDPLQPVPSEQNNNASQNIINGNNIKNNSTLKETNVGTTTKSNMTNTNAGTLSAENDSTFNGTDQNTNTITNGVPIQGLNGVDSATYKDLLEKYCFFKGPSTVSSFLAEEHDSTRNPLYDDKFY